MESEPYSVVLAPGARRALTDTLPPAAAFAAWEFISGPLRPADVSFDPTNIPRKIRAKK